MPISAAGSSARSAHRAACLSRPGRLAPSRRAGFTLLELLVVIAIMAIAVAGVSLSLRDTGQANIDREAERLAALFESARAQSRTSGVPVRWRPTAAGFEFDGLDPGTLPTQWLAEGMRAQPAAASGAPLATLQLGPEPIIAAQRVLLTAVGPPTRTLRIATDGLHPFAVTAP